MPQVHLPLFPEGITELTSHLGFQARDGRITYFYGHHPVFIHDQADLRTFRMITSQFVVSGVIKEAQIIKGFGLPPITVKRYVKLYREKGAAGFFQEPARRGAVVLTDEVIGQAQTLFDEGLSRSAVAARIGVKPNTLAKALRAGRLREREKKTLVATVDRPASNRSERSNADAIAPMGMGASNTLDRVSARLGLVNGVQPCFEHSLDVANAGVLLALPALLSNGLLRHLEQHFALPAGYYSLQQIFLLIAFLALCRIKCFEQLRYCAPGEWGKILGLDRIPEVKTLREKIEILSRQQTAEQWSSVLCKEWMAAQPEEAGVLYIDGHVRVYHGSQTKLPRHYVARQRLCLRATVDYWVNAMNGKPFFRINQAIDPGLISVLREEIIPALIRDVPGQPTKEQLEADPLLHRFTIVVDREGYSPDFFKEMKIERIAVITYHKFPKDTWPVEEFSEHYSREADKPTTVRLAERGTLLPNGLWVREIRKLTKSGHQTSLVATDYKSDLIPIATELFARWSQENFFKYMRENYNLDRLITNSTESIPDTTKVVNPQYRAIGSKLKSASSSLARRIQDFGALHLQGDIDPQQVQRYEREKSELQQQIELMRQKIQQIKEDRKAVPSHITVKELPPEQRFDRLSVQSKHLVDTIKMIAYRAETALATTIKEYLTDINDARKLIKSICTTEADLMPDLERKILIVRLHHQACCSHDVALKKLCDELNETETLYPGTELLLVYKIID